MRNFFYFLNFFVCGATVSQKSHLSIHSHALYMAKLPEKVSPTVAGGKADTKKRHMTIIYWYALL